MDSNKVKAIDRGSLNGLRRLRVLSLESNLVRVLSGVAAATALTRLNLAHNRVMEPGELEHLVPLTALRSLNMAATPLARRATHRVHALAVVPSLAELDGRAVEEEERDAADALVMQQEAFRQQQAALAAQQQAQQAAGKLPVRMQMVTLDGHPSAGSAYSSVRGSITCDLPSSPPPLSPSLSAPYI